MGLSLVVSPSSCLRLRGSSVAVYGRTTKSGGIVCLVVTLFPNSEVPPSWQSLTGGCQGLASSLRLHLRENAVWWQETNMTEDILSDWWPPECVTALQWRHNVCDGVSNHQPHDCLINCLSRRRSKKTSKLRVTGLCEGNSPVTGELPAQRASNAESVFIWWRHHGTIGRLIPVWHWKPRVVVMPTLSPHNDNLRYDQWRHNRHHDDYQFF